MVSDPFLVGVFFGFVPSMGFLYILLHRYEGLFAEKRAFFAYLLGLGGGLVATLMLFFLGLGSTESFGLRGLLLALFGVVHALIFTMVLNSKRFRARRDTPFYGVAFGLGFGALNVLFFVGNAVRSLTGAFDSILVETLTLSLLGLYFIASILLHSVVGAWIGRGAATKDLLAPVVQGSAVEAAFLGGFLLLFEDPWGTFVPFAAILVSILLVAHMMRTELDSIIPPEVKREMEIHRRRLARLTIREASQSNENGPDAARTPSPPPEETPPPGPGSN